MVVVILLDICIPGRAVLVSEKEGAAVILASCVQPKVLGDFATVERICKRREHTCQGIDRQAGANLDTSQGVRRSNRKCIAPTVRSKDAGLAVNGEAGADPDSA